jgi:SPP1 family predicted phage head-tail adaptor
MSLFKHLFRWGDARGLSVRLNKRITIQQAAEVADGAGGYVRSWTSVATVWAEMIVERSGGEQVFAEQVQAAARFRFTIRYRSGVTAAMRVLYGTRVFNIRQIINPEEANVLLVIEAEEGVAT